MAFPYYPSTFQPYQGNYYPTFQQPPQQMPQQSYAPAQTGIIWVSGEREAQMFPVAPNNAVTLWSQVEPIVYVKQADATGKPTLKVYDLVEHNVTDAAEKPADKSDQFVKKSDLGEILGVVKDFGGVIDSLKSDIEAMKSDMYGIAGKKKIVKKAEVEEDA